MPKAANRLRVEVPFLVWRRFSVEKPSSVRWFPIVRWRFFYIEKHDFQQLCREDMALLRNAVQVLAKQIREFAEIIESLALRSVEQRVAEHLVLVADGRGTRSGKAYIVELRLTRSGIANRIGSAREVVSRAFTHLEERGLIHVTSRKLLTIPDMPHLVNSPALHPGQTGSYSNA